MSWLLYLDESGHDRKQMPYEVRGGIAIEDRSLWPLTKSLRQLELESFGCQLREYGNELKGSTLLDAKRFQFANQGARMPNEERRKLCRAFLKKNQQKNPLKRDEFTAYGQACIEMAHGVFKLLREHRAVLFASMIPRDTPHPQIPFDEYLRKDHVYLLERFYFFLEREQQNGILIFDGTEKTADRKFISQMENYYTKTNTGRLRTKWIVPTPLFVSSEMSDAVQLADICIYCLNWSFRLPHLGMDEPVRDEIKSEFGSWIHELQYVGDGEKGGQIFKMWGINYVPNPVMPGRTPSK
ncbi:MAG: DUF3800 domain-containing protein [Gemmataceae bacterium]